MFWAWIYHIKFTKFIILFGTSRLLFYVSLALTASLLPTCCEFVTSQKLNRTKVDESTTNMYLIVSHAVRLLSVSTLRIFVSGIIRPCFDLFKLTSYMSLPMHLSAPVLSTVGATIRKQPPGTQTALGSTLYPGRRDICTLMSRVHIS